MISHGLTPLEGQIYVHCDKIRVGQQLHECAFRVCGILDTDLDKSQRFGVPEIELPVCVGELQIPVSLLEN